MEAPGIDAPVSPKKEVAGNIMDVKLEEMIDCSEDSYGLPVFSCNHCQLKNTKKSQILKHLRRLGKEKVIECDKCGRKFSEIKYLKTHKERVHEKKVKHECFVCEKGYMDKASLRSHLNIHDEARTPPKIFKEAYLPKELQEELQRTESVTFEQKELPKDLVCKFCGKIFMSQPGALRHERLHQDELKHKRIMDSLEFEATHKDDVKKVIKDEKVKIERNLLNVNVTASLTDKQESEKIFLFKCKTCVLQFVSSKLLRMHDCQNSEHESGKIFVFRCRRTCGLEFESSKLLRTHDCKNVGQSPEKHNDAHHVEEKRKNTADIEDFHQKQEIWENHPPIEDSHQKKEIWESPPTIGDAHNMKEILENPPAIEDAHHMKEIWNNPPTIDDLAQIENMKKFHLQKIKSEENYDDQTLFDSSKNEMSNEDEQQISTKKENDETLKRSQGLRVKFKKQPQLACPKCDMTFRSKRSWQLERHLRRHSFTCSECGKLHKNERALQEHVRLHARENAKDEPLGEDENSQHFKIYNFICDVCERGLSSEEDLVKHKESHKQDIIYQCQSEDCDQTFITNNLLLNHMMSVHKIDKDQVKAVTLKCVHCDFKSDRRVTLEGHLRRHIKERFVCTECGKKLKGKLSMRHHMKKHKGIYDVQCVECDKRFVSENSMRSHINSRHSKTIFICEECGKEFKLKQQYDRHLTLHTGELKIPCRDVGCQKMFRNYNARRDCERMHKGIKTFKCDLCSKLFMRSNTMKIHIKRHKGRKDFTCVTCGRAFVEPAGARKCKHSVIQSNARI